MTQKYQLSLEHSLLPIRKQIDELDAQLLNWLEKRIILIKEVGEIKKKYSAPVLSKSREDSILMKVRNEAVLRGIPELLVLDIWNAIFKAAYELEENHDR